jgi:mannose-6-phosphate isomerase-like protein (cupin superfamily)
MAHLAAPSQRAWLDVTAALEAGLAQCADDAPAIRTELATMRVALHDAQVQGDFHADPQPAYTALLTDALSGAEARFAGITVVLAKVRERLPWVYHYPPRSAEPGLSTRIAFAELIGPDGPMLARGVRVGLTLIAPHTVYPMHAHPAVELYWVISGHASWATHAGDRIAPPGDFVLHRSGEPHAMRTSQEPLLALWGWSGDIDAPATYV